MRLAKNIDFTRFLVLKEGLMTWKARANEIWPEVYWAWLIREKRNLFLSHVLSLFGYSPFTNMREQIIS